MHAFTVLLKNDCIHLLKTTSRNTNIVVRFSILGSGRACANRTCSSRRSTEPDYRRRSTRARRRGSCMLHQLLLLL